MLWRWHRSPNFSPSWKRGPCCLLLFGHNMLMLRAYIRIKYRQLHFNIENISNASCLEVEKTRWMWKQTPRRWGECSWLLGPLQEARLLTSFSWSPCLLVPLLQTLLAKFSSAETSWWSSMNPLSPPQGLLLCPSFSILLWSPGSCLLISWRKLRSLPRL